MKEIFAAIIGGMFSVGAAYLTWLLSRRPPEVGGFTDIPPQRIEGVKGTWVGELQQPDYPGGPITTQWRMRLDVKRATIIGTAEVTAQFNPQLHGRGEKVLIDLRMRGGFYTDTIIKLDYKNTTPGVLQFGTLVLRVNARSTEVTGQLVGYGSYSEQVINGQLQLRKS